MRLRAPILFLLLLAGATALPHIASAAIPNFGPIVPESIRTCPAAWGALVMVVNNIIEFSLTIIIVFIAPIMFMYAGFLYVVNPLNPPGLAKAKSVLINTIVGIVVALAAWMLVDAIMAVVYNAGGSNGTGGTLQTWSSIVTGNAEYFCLPDAVGLSSGAISGVTSSGTYSTTLSTTPGSPCNPATITAAAAAAGYSVSDQNAKLLACVAQGESTCGTKNPPYNLNYSWDKATSNGSASTAAGAYQVLLSTNSACYDNPVCETAGGTPGQALNCKTGFDSKGFPIAGSAVVSRCKQAAGNVNCSAAAAACLLQHQSFSSAYATDPYTASCLSAYGG